MKIKRTVESSFSLKSLLHSVISLTNSQGLMTKFLKPREMLPSICLPRFEKSSGLSTSESEKILEDIPSLACKPFTEYFLSVGEKFEREGNFRAACMSYVMGSFPKRSSMWKAKINERRKRTFHEWSKQAGFLFQERTLNIPDVGRLRFLISRPEGADSRNPVPALIFMNGSDGSAEEIAFSMLPYKSEPMAFVLMAVVGSVDCDFPMATDSERVTKALIDALETLEWLDSKNIGMVGFSFGAYWTFISAKTDSRIRYAVCNGMPFRHTFQMRTSFKLNPVITDSLMSLFQVRHPFFLLKIINTLVERADRLLYHPSGPILAINGDQDSIVDSRDTEIIGRAPGNQLLMLRNDDHCGLYKFDRMVKILVAWARRHSLNLRETQLG